MEYLQCVVLMERNYMGYKRAISLDMWSNQEPARLPLMCLGTACFHLRTRNVLPSHGWPSDPAENLCNCTKKSRYEKSWSLSPFAANITWLKRILGRHWGWNGLGFLCAFQETLNVIETSLLSSVGQSVGYMPSRCVRWWECGRGLLTGRPYSQFPQELKEGNLLMKFGDRVDIFVNLYVN